MIGILCKSAFLASGISSVAGEQSLVMSGTGAGNGSIPAKKWLASCLASNKVSLVFYEPRYLVDPSYFRQISPGTKFILISGPGDETDAHRALACGASAVLNKPFTVSDLRGVLALVQ